MELGKACGQCREYAAPEKVDFISNKLNSFHQLSQLTTELKNSKMTFLNKKVKRPDSNVMEITLYQKALINQHSIFLWKCISKQKQLPGSVL